MIHEYSRSKKKKERRSTKPIKASESARQSSSLKSNIYIYLACNILHKEIVIVCVCDSYCAVYNHATFFFADVAELSEENFYFLFNILYAQTLYFFFFFFFIIDT